MASLLLPASGPAEEVVVKQWLLSDEDSRDAIKEFLGVQRSQYQPRCHSLAYEELEGRDIQLVAFYPAADSWPRDPNGRSNQHAPFIQGNILVCATSSYCENGAMDRMFADLCLLADADEVLTMVGVWRMEIGDRAYKATPQQIAVTRVVKARMRTLLSVS